MNLEKNEHTHYIFIHGLGQNASSWNATIQELPMDIKIVCPNLFEWRLDTMDYQHLYERFAQYCDEQNSPLVLCGLSLGGVLALNYAVNHPHKVKQLILIGTQYRMPKRLLKLQNFIFQLLPKRLFESAGVSKKAMLSISKSMLDLDFGEKLDNILCPTLIICGAKDIANLKSAKHLDQHIRHSTLKIIQNAGHVLNVDSPQELGREINLFLTDHK